MTPRHFAVLSCLSAFLLSLGTAVRAEEGMWLYSAPPLQSLKARYQFEPDGPGWSICSKPLKMSPPPSFFMVT